MNFFCLRCLGVSLSIGLVSRKFMKFALMGFVADFFKKFQHIFIFLLFNAGEKLAAGVYP